MDFLEVQEAILFQIMATVEACGAQIAFPSSTVYHVGGEERRDPTSLGGARAAAPVNG